MFLTFALRTFLYSLRENSLISDVIAAPVFGDYGQLLFSVQSSYWSGTTLETLRWHVMMQKGDLLIVRKGKLIERIDHEANLPSSSTPSCTPRRGCTPSANAISTIFRLASRRLHITSTTT